MPRGIPIHQKISSAEVLRLHWEEGLTLEQIGMTFGYTPSSSRTIISQIFKERGLAHRSRSEAVKQRIKLHPETHRGFGKGEKHRLWKGGRHKREDGYIVLRLPDHPSSNARGNIYEHRLVWEQTHGKPVPKGWHIHHLNGIKHDNRPENLIAVAPKNHNRKSLIEALQARIRELEQLHLPL